MTDCNFSNNVIGLKKKKTKNQIKCCSANDILFARFLTFCLLCTFVKSRRLKMSIDFTSLQRVFLGLLTLGFQVLVQTNVAERFPI